MVLIASAVIVLGYLAFRYVTRPLDPKRAALAALHAYESRDAHDLWQLTPDYERKLYAGLGPASLEKLLMVVSLSPSGPAIVQEHPNDGSVDVTQTFLLPGDNRFNWSIGAELRTDHKAVVEGPVTSLLYMILYEAGQESGKRSDPSGPVARIYIAGIHRMSARLEQIGFGGVADSDFQRILPWSEVEANLLSNHAFRMAR